MTLIFHLLGITVVLLSIYLIRSSLNHEINKEQSKLIDSLIDKLASSTKVINEDTVMIQELTAVVISQRKEKEKMLSVITNQTDALNKLQKLVFELSPETEKLFNKVKLSIN